MAEQHEIDEAISVLRSHRPASDIKAEEIEGGSFVVSFKLKIRKPPRGFANRVLEQEPVVLIFSLAYPLRAPYIRLRPDFSRQLPHLNPSWERVSDHVNPCIVDESLDSFMRHHGFGQLISRLQKWLDDAAFDSLTRDDRYWEPIRRDGLEWYLTADRDKLVRFTSDKYPGVAYLPTYVTQVPESDEDFELFGVISRYEGKTPQEIARNLPPKNIRHAISIVMWPGSTVTDHYLPDNVLTFSELDARSKMCGCRLVSSAIATIGEKLVKAGIARTVLIFIILAVRRPQPLPDLFQDRYSNLELIPYLAKLEPKAMLGARGMTPHFEVSGFIFPFGLRYDTTPSLFQATSGISYPPDHGRIAIFGCGSLGSKIAIHIGKTGFGKFDLHDKRRISPHNLARLGIVNSHHITGMPKADALKKELALLGYSEVSANFSDVVTDLCKDKGLKLDPSTAYLIDATASPNVHDALCRGNIAAKKCTVIQSSFLAGGRLGYIAIEGRNRSPDVEDIKTSFWRYWAYAIDSKHTVWPSRSSLNNLRIGEGCESVTMVMSDMGASLLSAGISQKVSLLMRDSNNSNGKLSFGVVDTDQCSVQWHEQEIRASLVVPSDGTWEVRLLPDLVDEIQSQAEDAGNVETGGYLLGRINWTIRRISIAAQLPPPPDSILEQGRFVLGIENAQQRLLELHERSRRSLLAIGTWHSHSRGGRESTTDLSTLSDIAKDFFGTPAVSLIWTPDGFQALVKQSWVVTET